MTEALLGLVKRSGLTKEAFGKYSLANGLRYEVDGISTVLLWALLPLSSIFDEIALGVVNSPLLDCIYEFML